MKKHLGSVHISNVLVGATVPVTIMQVIATIFMGIFLASLYIRSGSIILPVLAHGLWDFIVLSTDTTVSNDAVMAQQAIDGSLVLACLTNVVIAIYAIWVMNKEKVNIRRIWDEKLTFR